MEAVFNAHLSRDAAACCCSLWGEQQHKWVVVELSSGEENDDEPEAAEDDEKKSDDKHGNEQTVFRSWRWDSGVHDGFLGDIWLMVRRIPGAGGGRMYRMTHYEMVLVEWTHPVSWV